MLNTQHVEMLFKILNFASKWWGIYWNNYGI